MAKSIGKKLKGLFMSKKKKNANISNVDFIGNPCIKSDNANKNAGFDVLNSPSEGDSGSQAADSDVIGDGLDISVGETVTEAPTEPEEAPEKVEEVEAPTEEVRAEKAHERVARIAAEKNTKGYGL